MAAQQAKAAGNKEEAITLFTQALEGLRGSGSEQLTVLESLVDLNLEQRHFENALTLIDQGLDLAQTEQDDKHEGWLLSRLGDLQALLGKEDGAESAYKEALNALRPVEDWLNIGMVLNKLSNLYMQQKRQEDAASILEQAVSIFERLGRTEDLINNLSRLADVHAEMLNWDQATTYLTQALNRVRNAGGVRDVFEQVSRLADLKEKSGNYQEALPHYQHALHLAFELDEPKAIGETLLALGRLMIDDGVQLNRVIQLLEAAFAYLPNNSDIQRLLKRAKTRQERLLKAGVDLLRPEENLREYARSAAQ
jgi:tetratricopeptide (TPR) repeat protein